LAREQAGKVTTLVIGRDGQVARALAAQAGADWQFVGRPDVDLAEPGSAARAIAEAQPSLVINAAAYTAVDRAESEPDLAMRVNGAALGEIGAAASAVGAGVIHFSTDYVFDGTGTRAWREDDATGPINVYGRSKLVGEDALRAATDDHLIFRTSWVYSATGANFVKTMLRLAGERDEVQVVNDQRGCPTSADDIAAAVIAFVERRWDGWGETYHLAGSGDCSWAEFAAHIFAESARLGGPGAAVVPILSSEFPTPARRPANSVLDGGKLAEALGRPQPDWREASARVVATLLAERR
jgi:dTDP-4-dehydrorhamnose reductase